MRNRRRTILWVRPPFTSTMTQTSASTPSYLAHRVIFHPDLSLFNSTL